MSGLAKDELQRLQRIQSWALRSEDVRKIAAMIDLARSEPGISVMPDELDRDPYLLNVSNGSIDLRTGRLRPHRKEDYITKICPVAFDAEAKAPRWHAFLERIFDGNQRLIRFVKLLAGYAATGSVREQLVFFLWGAGDNGKSVLVNVLMGVLGEDYAVKASRDLFMAKKQDNHPAQLARLFGKRLVACVETDEGARLDEGLVKELTGGDVICARRMREDPWQFRPTHKCLVVGNHKPQITGTDHAIWRRVRLIPFGVRIPEEEKDKNLEEKLMGEAPGVLRWVVEGAAEWHRDGLDTPDEVMEATREYRDEQDVLGRFLADRCAVGEGYRVRSGVLYEAFKTWAERSGEPPMSGRKFGQKVQERFKDKKSNGVWYLGVTLLGGDEPPSGGG